MAETLSHNQAMGTKQRASMVCRVQSPTSPFVLGSNDDKLERAQARAARDAAIRRRSVVVPPPASIPITPCLCREQILDLFQNCIKLSSENKINQKNTWELGLIDHICEIINVEDDSDLETNFQKASCTLEAGVKIYSMRVDYVHSEAYKVLGGINRAGNENEQDDMTNAVNIDNGASHMKKDQDRKMSPQSTLESSFEVLNVKKSDVAFAVDPLYHQTSAQFDEGGAKGLLLNNLGIYGECQVLFDSMEVPEMCNPCEIVHDVSDTIDLSSMSECIERMMLSVHRKDVISRTLRNIINQFDEDNQSPLESFSSISQLSKQGDSVNDKESEENGDAFQNYETWNIDHDDQGSMVDEDLNQADQFLPTLQEENEELNSQNIDTDDRFEKFDGYLRLGLGLNPKQNAWAGPDHWKYHKAECIQPAGENESLSTVKITRKKKQAEHDLDFTETLDDKQMKDLFLPPKNPKSLLLPANREPPNTKLPEDCHYEPQNLVKLFLLPSLMCIGKRRRKPLDEQFQDHVDEVGVMPPWDCQSDFGAQFDDGIEHSDVEDLSDLVSQPRQVNKIEVQYDKTSKQVDVQALKETLWDCIQEMTILDGVVCFKSIIGNLPSSCAAAAALEDISPHLCFISLLHLANEHGLRISGSPNLDDLIIQIPPSANHTRSLVHLQNCTKNNAKAADLRLWMQEFHFSLSETAPPRTAKRKNHPHTTPDLP